MSDITKISEMRTKDDGDWDEWPYPTVTIESAVTGELRARILQVLERADNGLSKIHLVETNVSGGYSEFTQEDECSIEVRIDDEVAWESKWNYSSVSAMETFLNKFTGPHTYPR